MLKNYTLILSVMIAFACPYAHAATLTTVPMQGGMVMPMIAYNQAAERLEVMIPATIPQLTPLLISDPGDHFDPANPWHTDLDPSAKGLSFNRQYGFIIDGDSDPLPPNTQIWLRKVSGDSGLGVYRYSASPAPGVWVPIFGTDGSPAEQFWNLMMFHPAFTAPPGTHTYTATFEAYLVSALTAQEIPGTATPPMVFNFTNVPDGRPALGAGLGFQVVWPADATHYVLEATSAIESGVWSAVTNQPVMMDGQWSVVLPLQAGPLHFRLKSDTP